MSALGCRVGAFTPTVFSRLFSTTADVPWEAEEKVLSVLCNTKGALKVAIKTIARLYLFQNRKIN